MNKVYDNTNSGTLFRNDYKSKPNQPDHKGSINVDGKEYWLSAWIKEAGPNAKNPGSKFFSLSVQPKDDAPKVDPNYTPDEDIPF